MQIFIDSASVGEIVKWLETGVIDGVTTNPTIILQDGVYDTEAGIRTISALVDPLPVCIEVTIDEPDSMAAQVRRFASWAPNIVIKIPHMTSDGVPCYGVIRELEVEGRRVNATAATSLGQVILAAKAGATYISLFSGGLPTKGVMLRRSSGWRWSGCSAGSSRVRWL